MPNKRSGGFFAPAWLTSSYSDATQSDGRHRQLLPVCAPSDSGCCEGRKASYWIAVMHARIGAVRLPGAGDLYGSTRRTYRLEAGRWRAPFGTPAAASRTRQFRACGSDGLTWDGATRGQRGKGAEAAGVGEGGEVRVHPL